MTQVHSRHQKERATSITTRERERDGMCHNASFLDLCSASLHLPHIHMSLRQGAIHTNTCPSPSSVSALFQASALCLLRLLDHSLLHVSRQLLTKSCTLCIVSADGRSGGLDGLQARNGKGSRRCECQGRDKKRETKTVTKRIERDWTVRARANE